MALIINQALTDKAGGNVASGTIIYFGSNFHRAGKKVIISMFAYKTNAVFAANGNDYAFTELPDDYYSFEWDIPSDFWTNPLQKLHDAVKAWLVSKSTIPANNIQIVLPS